MPPIIFPDQNITLDVATRFVNNFRQNLPPEEIKGWSVGTEILHRILGQPGCHGIRLYRAINDMGEQTLVLVGIDSDGNDMTKDEVLGEFIYPCPPVCTSTGPFS